MNQSSSSTQPLKKSGDIISISFDDNRILQELLGEFDQNLALIEHRLKVTATALGNTVQLAGPKQECEQAIVVLKSLYDSLKNGNDVTQGDVDGALRMADHMKEEAVSADYDSSVETDRTIQPAQISTRQKTLTARSAKQDQYIRMLQKAELIFATGPAGTGKTYIAVAQAVSMMEKGLVDRIILSRPAVEAGESLGFLPGDMRDKVDPYLRPLFDALYDMMPQEKVERGMQNGQIEIAPLAFMRGRTLASSAIILDEAQNCTPMQMKMFLTRFGEGSRMIITGDPSQIDLPKKQKSGLQDAVNLLRKVKGVKMIAFSDEDVVRHELVARIVAAYSKREDD